LTGECLLLREHELGEIFRSGRCQPSEMLKKFVRKHLTQKQDLIERHAYEDSLVFEITAQLSSKRLQQRFTLHSLQRYLNTTAYNHVIQLLRAEGHLPPSKCEACVFLSRSKPYVCRRETIPDAAELQRENPFYGQPRRPSQRACQDGFEPFLLNQEIESSGKNDADQHSRLLLSDMTQMLRERTESAEGSQQAVFARQYQLFCDMQTLFITGIDEGDAITAIAEQWETSYKQIWRDWQAICQFFRKRLSIEREKYHLL
jgi:hypothetical protein